MAQRQARLHLCDHHLRLFLGLVERAAADKVGGDLLANLVQWPGGGFNDLADRDDGVIMLAQILDHRIVVGRKRERRLHDGLERWRQLEVRMIRSLTARGERRRDGFRKIVRRSEEHTSELQSLMRISY